jgi:hypothetical protein
LPSAPLQQRVRDAWQPIAFYSHKLSPAERKYNPYDRELPSGVSGHLVQGDKKTVTFEKTQQKL